MSEILDLLKYCKTEYQEQIVRWVDEYGSPTKAADSLGMDGGNFRNAYRKVQRRAQKDQGLSLSGKKTKFEQLNGKGFVITSAQNQTKINSGFLDSLKVYCEHHGYKLIVIPYRYYNNLASSRTAKWHSDLDEYLFDGDGVIFDKIKLYGSVKVRPTASNPLSGMETMSGEDWAIFGHAKVALRSLPTKVGSHAKMVWTTGSITEPNYTDSKDGKKGEFHHVIGALVVEKGKVAPNVRNLIAQSDGSFYDLDKKYSRHGVSESEYVSTVTLGDLHGVYACQKTLTKGLSLLKKLRPKRVFVHDVLDFGSASHHNDFFEKFRRHHSGESSIEKELIETCKLLDKVSGYTGQLNIVSSNHNEHFYRWLEDKRNVNCLQNAKIYAETRAYYLSELEKGKEPKSPLEYWAEKYCKNFTKMRFLGRFDSATYHGVEHAFHGDKGSGGARGSTANLSKIGSKVTKGHDHKAEIVDGCMSAGTFSGLTPPYIAGTPSGWVNSLVILYRNGKRTHYNFFN